MESNNKEQVLFCQKNVSHALVLFMSVPYRITIRVSEGTLKKLEKLVENYHYESVSDVIRKAIDDLIEKNYKEEGIEKLRVTVPKSFLERLNIKMEADEDLPLEDIIKTAIREYTSKKMKDEMKELSDELNRKE